MIPPQYRRNSATRTEDPFFLKITALKRRNGESTANANKILKEIDQNIINTLSMGPNDVKDNNPRSTTILGSLKMRESYFGIEISKR